MKHHRSGFNLISDVTRTIFSLSILNSFSGNRRQQTNLVSEAPWRFVVCFLAFICLSPTLLCFGSSG